MISAPANSASPDGDVLRPTPVNMGGHMAAGDVNAWLDSFPLTARAGVVVMVMTVNKMTAQRRDRRRVSRRGALSPFSHVIAFNLMP